MGSEYFSLIFLCIVSIVIFYFLYWRPKKAREEAVRRYHEQLLKLAQQRRLMEAQNKSYSKKVCF
jgi:preprotein translocase subunit YajC